MTRRVDDLVAWDVLDAVARTGSMSAAARECRMSQQAVSARVRDIERRVGLTLFTRSPHGVTPTAAGESVVAWARDVLVAASRLDAAVDLLHAAVRRTLAVGGSQTVAARLLPGWMLRLRRRQLDDGAKPTAIRLRTGNSAEIARLVASGSLDMGFVESPDVSVDLARATVATDRLVVVVAPVHAWTGSVSLEELAVTPLVAREEGSGTRLAYEMAVRARLGVDPVPPALVLNTTVAVLQAVAGGVAPAVLSELAVSDDVELGRVRAVAIAGPPITRPITALWRPAVALPDPARVLLDIARSVG